MEFIFSLLSVIGFNGILLFFVKRFFDQRDRKEKILWDEQRRKEEEKSREQEEIYHQIKISLETIRLLAYARMSEETERLLSQGFVTPSERHILDEMYHNYKEHGWNGDMDARLEKIYALRTNCIS